MEASKSRSKPKPKTKDVEMKDAEETTKEENSKAKDETETPKETDLITLEDFKEHVKHIEKAVSSKEKNYMSRVVRALSSSRRKLNHNVLRKLIMGYYPPNNPEKDVLLPFLDEPMDTETDKINFRPRSAKAHLQPLLPELDVYFHLLVVIHLIDTKIIKICSDLLVAKLDAINRRTMDQLSAKAYFYHSRTYELTDQLDKVRSFLHAKLRTSTLRHNIEAQATILNLLLRNYLLYNLYDQADKLVTKSTFPDHVSNHEWARFLSTYLGRIKAIQLEYSEAEKNLTQALRKAPQSTAVGFKQTVHKLNIIVQLLLGEIPDRSLFREKIYKKALAPYFQLTQAVRTGNLGLFNQVLETFGSKFQQDGTYTLIIRLHHNVIKTGVRMISLSYSKISLVDVAKKLQLDSPEDAEFIVAKAIRDGVIEATIDHEKGFIRSKETVDVYATREPMNAYHQRISFCLDIHNQAVKAMRFPPKSYNKDLESAEDRRERDKQDLELAKEMAEDDEDSF
ncbi:putative 26S proteasome non-ATPase regulatory subunit 3 isoform X2 [Apostichopus japonicus]|uniref:26S proteasome regulatory subunit RPN3 n=1 Tax=Stichopus japonicus TaxID=307972 RepID=A0A2G8JE35_STIJA|nr:putative 26S proteasome non-ATPase regulatory subunit 3 isoform X2 [Apostichopus japonicus]